MHGVVLVDHLLLHVGRCGAARDIGAARDVGKQGHLVAPWLCGHSMTSTGPRSRHWSSLSPSHGREFMQWCSAALVLHAAVDGAMRGDSLRASQGLNLCKPLTGLLGPDVLPTATARKCHISSALALVRLALCHDACMREACHVCRRAYFGYIAIAQDGVY